jgi:arabinose-5-phosphate isomerase
MAIQTAMRHRKPARPPAASTAGVLAELRRVLDLELKTLGRIRASLDGTYAQAVERLASCRGKVIVTGMGKSGLIGQKIAATMASTGTPAIFLHPADGMHGDLGLVQPRDVVLALSKSGESEELTSILPSLKQIGTTLIALTAEAGSTLARSADVLLLMPVEEEACPLNLAPTCSTTAALVIGDALAMALMQRRGFRPEQFALYHPGGQLGKRLLLTVAELMRGGEQNPTIRAEETVERMLVEITNKRSGAVSVVDGEGKLVGLVTDYDIRRALERRVDLYASSIRELMNPRPTFIYSDEKAVRALELMEKRERPFMVLPVLDRKTQRVAGMVHLHDLVAKGL